MGLYEKFNGLRSAQSDNFVENQMTSQKKNPSNWRPVLYLKNHTVIPIICIDVEFVTEYFQKNLLE